MRGVSLDLRYGWRSLRRSPGFTALVVLVVGLGIGANAAIFNLINALFLRSLPVRDPARLVLFEAGTSEGLSTVLHPGRLDHVSYPLYQRLRGEGAALFEDVAAQDSAPLVAAVGLGMGSRPSTESATGRAVSASYFAVLGVPAILGRGLLPQDERADASPVLVLSHGFWRRRLGGDAAVIGRRLLVNGKAHAVVGVAPPGFTGIVVGQAADFWIPIASRPPPYLESPRHRWLLLIGRLRPGIALATAQAGVNLTLQRFLADHPAESWILSPREVSRRSIRIELEPGATGTSTIRPLLREPLLVLLGGVGLLLLVVCLNLSHLQLARALNRQREMSIRSALGASRGRLLRQLLAEALLLGALGTAAAALVQSWLCESLLALAASGPWSRLQLEVVADARVLAFMLGLALAVTVVLGLVPAWGASRPDLQRALSATSQSVTVAGNRRLLHRLLLMSQVAFAMVLLVWAGLLAGSLGRLRGTDKGFAEQDLLLARLRHAPGFDREQAATLQDEVARRVARLPGVSAASLSDGAGRLISGGSRFARILVRGTRDSSDPASLTEVGWHVGTVTPGYFETVGLTLLRGRGLAARDHRSAPAVAVVNEALARRFFDASDLARVLGRRFSLEGREAEIVGVVNDARNQSLRQPAAPTAYVPAAQWPTTLLRSLEVRATVPPAQLAEPIRRVVGEVHPGLAVATLHTVRQQIDRTLVQERLLTRLSAGFGLAALFLVSIGLYGVISQWAGQRGREIAVRMALGATSAGVRWLVMRQAFVLVLAGLAVGLPAAVAVATLLERFLYGLAPGDPLTLALAAAATLGVAALAAYLPARRASRVDPMLALRSVD